MRATLTTRDGLTLAAEDGRIAEARARILIVHGYAEHMGRYGELVDALESARFECHRFDLRGHGQSEGERGHVARFQDYLDDLAIAVEHVRTLGPEPLPLILVAHSLGGLIALSYVHGGVAGVDALAVSSPFLRPGFELSAGRQLFAAVAAHLVPRLTVDSGLDPQWLSHDQEVVDQYVNDPLVQRKTTPGWFKEVERAQGELLEGAAGIRLPLLMMLGSDDRIADHHTAMHLFELTSSGDKTLRCYEGLRHEVFNEISRATVIAELTAWLTAHS